MLLYFRCLLIDVSFIVFLEDAFKVSINTEETFLCLCSDFFIVLSLSCGKVTIKCVVDTKYRGEFLCEKIPIPLTKGKMSKS